MSKRRYRHLSIAVSGALMIGALGLFQPTVQARGGVVLPTGGISSTAKMTRETIDGKQGLDITGSTANNIIAWEDFSIGADGVVRFNPYNDAATAYLNYVTGNKISEIYGSILGGEKSHVYLVNPNGIIFGENAQINVGSLYASTRNLEDIDFDGFARTGGLNSIIAKDITRGDIVNRMESDLHGMNITFEGDTVTFSKVIVNDGKGVLNPGSGTAPKYYMLANNGIYAGYEGEAAPVLNSVDNLYGSMADDITLLKRIDSMAEVTEQNGQYLLTQDVTETPVTVSLFTYMLPTGGISDTAAITTDFDKHYLTVDGTVSPAVKNHLIAWDTFSIGRQAGVGFTGQNLNYLNYVTGKNLSEIYGRMDSDKSNNIFLLNPNGIIFGEGATLNLGSLYASTRRVTEKDLTSFENSGKLAETYTTVGDVVNRMENDLGTMNLTLEGDNVSFAKSSLGEDGKVTLGRGGIYTVNADSMTVGYEDKTPADNAVITNLTNENYKPTYAQLIGQEEISQGVLKDSPAAYMLKENVGGPALTEGIFYGTLDGAGHSVALDGESFFGGTLKDATVRNLTLTGKVEGTLDNLGALANTAYGSKIANVFNEASVTAEKQSQNGTVGGLVGQMTGGSLKNVANTGQIESMSGDFYRAVGGLAGRTSNVDIAEVWNTGAINSYGKHGVAGGIVGWVNDDKKGSLTNSYNTGNISGWDVGGLVGWELSYKHYISNVFNSGNLKVYAQDSGYNDGHYGAAGGLIGKNGVGHDVNVTITNAYNSGNITYEPLDGNPDAVPRTAPLGNAIKWAIVGGNPNFTYQNAYSTGQINGANTYAYWEADGKAHQENVTAADIAAYFSQDKANWAMGRQLESAPPLLLTSTRRLRGVDSLPVLKAFMTPLHLTDKTYTYAEKDGQPVERSIYYGDSAHLQNQGDQYGTGSKDEDKTYTATLTSDQLGYYLIGADGKLKADNNVTMTITKPVVDDNKPGGGDNKPGGGDNKPGGGDNSGGNNGGGNHPAPAPGNNPSAGPTNAPENTPATQDAAHAAAPTGSQATGQPQTGNPATDEMKQALANGDRTGETVLAGERMMDAAAHQEPASIPAANGNDETSDNNEEDKENANTNTKNANTNNPILDTTGSTPQPHVSEEAISRMMGNEG